MSCDKDTISFGIVLHRDDCFHLNGQQFRYDHILVSPPAGELHLISPVGGTVMAIVINRDQLLSQPGLSPAVTDWFLSATRRTALWRSPALASRLREDALQAMENAALGGTSSDDLGPIAGKALIAGIASKLSLEWDRLRHETGNRAVSYSRFHDCRSVIHGKWEDISDFDGLLASTGTAKRTLQDTFSNHIGMGPLTYMRVVRLHLARRALHNADLSGLSIGDIASRHGFWNWSRFTQQYRHQFGELPSETRVKVAPGK